MEWKKLYQPISSKLVKQHKRPHVHNVTSEHFQWVHYLKHCMWQLSYKYYSLSYEINH
jgi:hypothetical protein